MKANTSARGHWILTLILSLFAFLRPVEALGAPQAEARFDVGEFSELSVLYAGFPETDREQAFVKLLGSAFARVETIELEKLDSAAAENFDVVVADWTERFEDGRFVGQQGFENRLGRDFTKPVVMVGAIGGRLTEGTKFNHL